MNFKRNFVFSVISALALMNISDAYAAAQEVIYKVHDIHSVKNEADVSSCEFSLTFFNRSDTAVRNLSLDIGWKDDVIENKIKEEKAEKTTDQKTGIQGYNGKSQTEKFTSKMVSTSLSVPPLMPKQQVSIKSKINTDRCFLLMQRPELIIRKCSYGTDSDKGAGACNNLFSFVSPEDDQYYTEFKEISYEEEKNMEQQKVMEEKKELDLLYSNAITSVKRISSTLNSMQ